MNTSKKGYNKELECRKILEKQGYKIVFKSIRWRWGTLDYAGLFDSIFVRNGVENQEPVKQRLHVSNKHLGDFNYYLPHQATIRAFKEDFGLEGDLFQLWIWNKPRWVGRGVKKHWQKAQWQIINL